MDFLEFLEDRSASWMLGELGSGFFGVVFSQVASNLHEQWTLACRHHLLDDPESPDDILPILAKDRRLDRYYLETSGQHRARLIDAWNIYAIGGSETVVNEQLRAAGFGPNNTSPAWGEPGIIWGSPGYYWADIGTYVQFRPWALGPRNEPSPYWSQYWIVFASGFHPVSGPPIPWGSFVWGDTHNGVWGPFGYTQDFKRTIIAIARKWKPSRWILRGFLFRDDPTIIWGEAGFIWGDTGHHWGGGFEVTVPLA